MIVKIANELKVRVIRSLVVKNVYLLFVLFAISPLTTHAQLEHSFEQQLTSIKENKDLALALTQIDKLSLSPSLSALQSFELLYEKSMLHLRASELSQALHVMQKALLFAENNYLREQQTLAQKMVGVFHYYKGEYALALDAYNKALTQYQLDGEHLKEAHLLNNLGLVYSNMGDVKQALEQFKLAEPLYQKFGTEADKNDVRHNIATVYLRLKRFDIAIEIFHEVIDKRIILNDFSGAAEVYGNLGTTYKQAGQFQQAKDYLLRSLDFYKEQNDLYNSAAQLHNLAELYNQTYEHDLTINYAKQAIVIAEKVGHKAAYSGAQYSLAKAQFAFGEWALALQHLTLSQQAAKEMNYQNQMIENNALFALLYAASGQYQQSLSVHQSYLFDSNKLANEALNEQLAKFDSTQLKQQVVQLQQQKKLQTLELEKEDQLRNFAIISIILLALAAFFFYRRNAERNIKEKLKAKVSQRTKDLEDLMQALLKANQVKSQFLANMSHEIRTPLTAVIGQAEAIVHGDVPEEYLLEEVEVIHDNSVHLLELINDTLDLSKIEANKLELNITDGDLHQLIHQIEQMFFERTTAKGLSFEIVHNLPKPFVISVDHFRLKQVLINLCSNAVKFTLKGKVTIDIAHQGKNIVFKVIDTGIGLDSQQVDKIFRSFTQGDSSIARNFGGSGLGLSLSDKLVKLMHGEIRVQSEIHKGSVFSVIVPCIQVQSELSVLSALECDREYVEPKKLNGKVLLAEDHVDNRRLFVRLLTKLGLEVYSAENGREAVELCRQHQPDLLLLDIQMPEMDGIEAYKVLREQGFQQPIVAITANAMAEDLAQYTSLGFDSCIKKPVERKVFIRAVAKYFKVEKPIAELEAEADKLNISDLKIQFISGLKEDKKQLLKALANENLAMLSEQAHRLAGAAQMFGFAVLSEQAIALEQGIKNKDIIGIAVLTELLCEQISEELIQQ
ncbi:response regulator [Thalassotalea sp. PLHSN55]|uniref:response regulator n=1 Tax=Thalassotalea sp. PLHSN55 TaxID=3435888 RepID=UPI003F851AA1